jgi:ribose transport system substrate-binding protein
MRYGSSELTRGSVVQQFVKAGEAVQIRERCVSDFQQKAPHGHTQQFERFACITLTLAIWCVFGCHKSESEKIAILTRTAGDPMPDTVHVGATFAAQTCGLRPHYTAPASEDDLQAQLALFNSFKERGFAGIILVPIQPQALRYTVERAVSRGLPVVVLGSELGIANDNLAYILNDEETGSELAARRLNEVLAGKGTVAVTGLDVSSSTSVKRLNALQHQIMSHYPGIRLLDPTIAGNSVAEQEHLAQKLLRGPQHIDAIVALGSASTRGTFYAIVEEALPQHVALIGFDQELLPTNGDLLIEGVIAQRTRDMGQLAAQAICGRLAGKPMTPRTVLQPFLITPDNFRSVAVQTQLSRNWWDPPKEPR